MGRSFSEADWVKVSERVSTAIGLHFPAGRRGDLQRGLARAAPELGFHDGAACASWLLAEDASAEQWQAIASHLTVGETYFFREPAAFDLVARDVVPALIRSRRGKMPRLRFWSAACCSGEEAYSLAILVHQLLPDLKDWQVTILATDINPRFLQKAVAGVYGEWSFRNAPSDLKKSYFTARADGRYEVIPEIKAMVTFAHLNLAQDNYPSLATDTNAMDLIFCRNVLMYFSAAQIQRVIANLHHCLIDEGWLVVSPSETSQALFARFATHNFPGVILYQKTSAKIDPRPAKSWPNERDRADPSFIAHDRSAPNAATKGTAGEIAPVESAFTLARALYEQGHYAEAAEILTGPKEVPAREAKLFSLLARALANEGKLEEALASCEQWLDADRLDSAGHYLRAIILIEQGDAVQARTSLQRAVYLAPTFVLAHFALANLARSEGQTGDAARHFTNARQLLTRLQPNELLPESDGLTAARLSETISVLTLAEVVR